jgi:hypothetical protein
MGFSIYALPTAYFDAGEKFKYRRILIRTILLQETEHNFEYYCKAIS